MLRSPPDILITTPESLFLMLTSRAREMLETVRVADRGRGSRRCRDEARRPPRPQPRAARAPGRRSRSSASGSPPPSARSTEIGRFVSGGRPIELVDAGRAKELDLQVVVPLEDMREPGRGQLDLALDLPGAARARRGAPLHDRLRQQPPAGGAPRPAPQRAGGEGDRARPPRLARARAADRGRGAPEEGRDPRPRRHFVARARHRHGGSRPRRPGRVAQVRRPWPAARRPGGAPSRRAVQGTHLPEVPSRPSRVRRRRPPDARGRDRGDQDRSQPPRRPGAADRRDLPPRRRSPSTSCTSSSAARTLPRPLAPAARERPRHARRPLPLGGVRRAAPAHRLGPRPRARPRPRRARAGSRSRTRARSPTAASSASISWTGAAASASSTRRWSTRPAPGRPSCSAPRPGGSRRSPATACSSRPRPACPASCRSGKARASAAPTSSARRSGAPARELVALDDERALARLTERASARRARGAEPAHVPARAGGGDGRSALRTARSSSSASATRSATGGSASSRPSAAACTRPGRSRSPPACASRSAWR